MPKVLNGDGIYREEAVQDRNLLAEPSCLYSNGNNVGCASVGGWLFGEFATLLS